ncbi:hypothetical protein GOODEAATRI_013744, partial [Goodea atripinnis]
SQSQGSITLKIIPAIKEEDRLRDSKVYMRALFDYTPLEDKATPCQEAGLPFKRGDILQVVTQDDPTWWQAKRVGDNNLRAGLIPSKQFQERVSQGQAVLGVLPQHSGLRRSFRLSRKDRQESSGEGSELGESDFLTYEEVTRYQHRSNERPRLVVLIGSLGARINELKQRVIAENPHRYAVAVPRKFIEHGEYKENQYGTSIEAIRSVQAKNKMCIVDVQPEALKRLRTAEFKPYVIFVKPRIPESRRRRSAATSPGGGEHGRLTEMRQSAVQIDQQYGHLVDCVLIKEDSAGACAELRGILERLERDSFWVPLIWVRT